MILSCDPPRHAFLIHFGKRQHAGEVGSLTFSEQGARVEIAVDTRSVPATLLAIHFVRHGFQLPFISPRDKFSTEHFHLRLGFRERHCFFHFRYEPHGYREWRVYPGLTILVSGGRDPGAGLPREVEDRPLLHGLVVDTEILGVEVDMTEFVFEFDTDSLKDVPVTLFLERTGT